MITYGYVLGEFFQSTRDILLFPYRISKPTAAWVKPNLFKNDTIISSQWRYDSGGGGDGDGVGALGLAEMLT